MTGSTDVAAPADTARDTFAPALEHIECLPLGEAVILHNRESGAMVASNAFGALLIEQLRQVPEVDAVVLRVATDLDWPDPEAREAVEATLRRWAEDGVFLPAAKPFPRPVAYRAAVDAAPRRLALGPRAVVLRSENAELAADVARAVAPMGLAPTGSGRAVQLEVVEEDGVFGVFRDGAPVWGAAPYELSRFHLLREIMDVLCGPERVSAHLHASAVALGGTGLVFAGASGSGKSTLATALLGAGAALVADDHVAVDIDSTALLAFPTRPNLKPGARNVQALGAVMRGQSEADFVADRRVPVGEAVRLAGFVFPRFDPEADNTFTPLDPAVALRGLIQTGSRVSRTTKSIAPLVRALDAHPVHQLIYHETEFAIGKCLALLGR